MAQGFAALLPKMKKKNDKTKELTSNERKELRRLELEKEESKAAKKNGAAASGDNSSTELQSSDTAAFSDVAAIETTSEASGDDTATFSADASSAAVAEQPKRKLPLWAIITAGILALAILIMGILTPTVIVPARRFSNINNPVVVFRLSTGDDIEIIVFEEEVPHAATNFLHLARIGFFNDTIIFDTNEQFVRFGQFENDTFRAHRTTNQSFLNRLSDNNAPTLGVAEAVITDANRQNFSIFDYRVNIDNASTAIPFRPRTTTAGYISNMHTLSGVDFQIATVNDRRTIVYNNIPQGTSPRDARNSIDLTGHVFGRVTEDSMQTLHRITALTQQTAEQSAHPFFNPPIAEGGGSVYIRRTRVYNVSAFGHWRNFNWDSYFMATPQLVTWPAAGGGGFSQVRDLRFVRE